MRGLKNNNSKPFWKYVKSRKQDNIGVSPLKSNGQLVNDSKAKADITNSNQYLPEKETKHCQKQRSI